MWYYRHRSNFLAALNNEKSGQISPSIKKRFESLNGFMMIAYTEDKMVMPWETQWLMEYGANGKLIQFRKSRFYTANLIGLRTLD